MTPHVSNTCWDNWSNCGSLAATHCYQSQISSNCCLSCGLGNTMTTHVTPHTVHPWCRSRHDPRGQQHLLRHLLQLRLAVRLLLRQPLQEGVWPLLSGAGRGGAGRGGAGAASNHPTLVSLWPRHSTVASLETAHATSNKYYDPVFLSRLYFKPHNNGNISALSLLLFHYHSTFSFSFNGYLVFSLNAYLATSYS